MLDEKRVILMTKMASYEADEGRKSLDITRYFFSDYCIAEVIKAFLCATISFLLGTVLYVLYRMDELMADIYQIDLVAFGKSILKYYIITVVIYVIVCYAFAAYRYLKARKSLKVYSHNLKKLSSLYKESGR